MKKLLLIIALFVLGCEFTSCDINTSVKTLKNSEVIQGYPCKGRVHFDEFGKILMFTLSEDYEILGNVIPNGSRCEKDRIGGFMIYLYEDINIQGFIASSKYKSKQWHVSIDSNGKLKRFMSVNDIEIDGIPCSSHKWIDLYPNGHLQHVNLSKDFEIDGILYESGTTLEIDKNGKARKIRSI